MKKVIALVAAAAFVLSLAGMASAAHQGRHNLGTSGMFQTGIMYTDNENFSDESGDNQSQFEAHQRLRQYFDYVASENLKAVVGYEFDQVWGSADAPAGADTTSQLELKRAHMEFTLPGTETVMKSGIQWVELPSVALGSNPVLASDIAGAVVSTPVTEIADLTFGWTRPYNKAGQQSAAPGVDSFFATLPIDQDGYSVSPFGVYTFVGEDARSNPYNLQDDASMYHLGAALDMNAFDPMGISGSFIYGSLSADQDTNDAAGWYADLAVSFDMEGMTPEIYGMYASGDDDDATDGSEEMPIIANTALTSPYPSMMLGDATYLGITDEDSVAGVGLLSFDPQGVMTIGARLKQIALTENLSGTLQAAFYQGTKDEETAIGAPDTFTEEDSAMEVTASANYQIYEQLSAICETGYAQIDYDDGFPNRVKDYKDDPAAKFGVGLVYSF